MFGKFFASTFTGSMFGAGTDLFAVWGYVIANAVNSNVELNPPLLAAILGSTPERITAAITKLCEPDPISRNPKNDGRRLIREGQYQYRVVSHQLYRAVRNEEDRRAYNRQKQQESRARKASNTPSMTVIDSNVKSTSSAHTEAEAEAEAEADVIKKERKNGDDSLSLSDLQQKRVRGLSERYPTIYSKVRSGAHYRANPVRDYPNYCELVRGWQDDRLDKMLELFLLMPKKDANNVPGTPGQFLNMAPECDRRLRENGL